MNGARKLMLMILVGILIAASIIAGVTALEQNGFLSGPPSTTVTSSTTITTSAPVQTGVLAAQITDPPDPPNAPVGTTHIYVNYSDIEAHTTTQNSGSVWFTVAKAGMIDLFSVLNNSLTLGSATVASGIFDQARFDITNATVTFEGINYTASVPLNQIIVPLSNGGALVKPNASAGFIIDVIPTVLALNNGGTPNFEIITATQGLSIPPQSWTGSLVVTGSRIQNVTSQTWWKGPTPIGDNLTEEVPALIYPTYLLVILNNTGSAPITISGLNILTTGAQSSQNGATLSTSTIVSTFTTVTTITSVMTITGNSSGKSASPAAPHTTATSSSPSQITIATFLILTNGSVIQPRPNSAPIPSSQVGLTIKPNQVVVLLYLGIINTLASPKPPYAPQNFIGGQEYAIQIVTPFGSSTQFNVNASYPS